MAHELSITVEIDGEFINLPTVVAGKKITTDEAVRRFRDGKQKPLGGRTFKTLEAAVRAAKKRSRSFDNPFSRVR